jgi:hypothetical protein
LRVESRSDARGSYLLPDLPVGVHVVRVEYPAGPSLEVADVRVHADLTGRLDFRFETGMGGEPRVVAVPAPRAASGPTSRVTLSGDLLRVLPVDDIRSALRTEVGVVETDAGDGPCVRAEVARRPYSSTTFRSGLRPGARSRSGPAPTRSRKAPSSPARSPSRSGTRSPVSSIW